MSTKMSLKVLYTVDKETNSYLARSKELVDVRVECIPSPSNDGSQIQIGIIVLNDVLQEICSSSPELFSPSPDTSVDYNVYCRDICELDEPLVSCGLLSKLRNGPTDQLEGNPDSWPLVMGRVCSNFSAMLRFQNTPSPSSMHQTLEIKIRFSRVVTANSSRRSSFSGKAPSNLAPNVAPSIANVGSAPRRPYRNTTDLSKPGAPAKRQTNPMPAPKAARTQSLPIWNQAKNNQFALPTNSIAHKIYLADRASRESDSMQKPNQDKRSVVYQINSLQQDNTIQKTKVDESVSKRFDFITKKKGKMAKPTMKKPTPKPKSATGRKVRRDSLQNTSTPLPQDTQSQSSASKGEDLEDFRVINDDAIVQQFLSKQKLKSAEFFELDQEKIEESDNKENIPPRAVQVASRFEDLLGMDIPSLKTPSDSDKGTSNPRSDDPLEWFNDIFGYSAGNQKVVTPIKDPLTCNTMPIEDEDQDGNKTLTSDLDRTSPMDTLSMPLYELEQKKQLKSSKSIPSCKEQLSRMPLLSKNARSGIQEEDGADETSPVVLSFPTSPKPDNSHFQERQKRPAPVSSPVDDEDYMDEYLRERRRKRKTMPSSPTSMFPYQEQDDDDAGTVGEHTITNEEFSINERQERDGAGSTPATQYRSSDVENMKHGESNSADTKEHRFLHI